MQILLDDIPCDFEAHTVGEAIDGAAAIARGAGRMVVDVAVDGAPWTETDLTPSRLTTTTAEVVHLTSVEPVAMVGQILEEASEALTEADRLQREAAELLQSDRRVVSMDTLDEAIAIWQSVQEAIVKGAHLVGLDLDALDMPTPVRTSCDGLIERLTSLRRALADHDDVAVSDTLLYEFPAVVEEWRAILARLQRCLADRAESS